MEVMLFITGNHSYLIRKLIGSGAFANIYLAEDIHTGDKKALKVRWLTEYCSLGQFQSRKKLYRSQKWQYKNFNTSIILTTAL